MLVRSAVVTLSAAGALLLPLSDAEATTTSVASASHVTADDADLSQNWLPVH